MKKNRLIALIMAICMAACMTLVMTACGGSQSEEAAVQNTEASEEAVPAEKGQETTAASPEATDELVALSGEYEDEYSQRANAVVVANTEAQTVNIAVRWGSSATETAQWTMTAVKDGNRLVYDDCIKKNMVSDGTEDSPETEEIISEDGSGYFEITDDGKLLWTGAEEADCQQCAFVKVEF